MDSGGGNEDATYRTNGANISNDNWHHLVITYGDGLKIFVDGVERLNQSPFSGPLDSSQDSPLSLGMGRIFLISGEILMDPSMISEFTVLKSMQVR